MVRFLSVLGFAALTPAHMQMSYPPPFRSKHTPYTNATDTDYSMTSPLESSGSDFPCKGYHALLDNAPGQVGRLVASRAVLQHHRRGERHARRRLLPGLPLVRPGQLLEGPFTPTSAAVRSLRPGPLLSPTTRRREKPSLRGSWFNKIGNREMYIKCAHVTVRSRGRQRVRRGGSDPLGSRPAMFVANVGNGCGTLEGADVLFPHPGPDVDYVSLMTARPVGNCK